MPDDERPDAETLPADRPRNHRLVDPWSFVHVAATALLSLLVGPLPAFVLALLWEPLEVLVLSPTLARVGIEFGHESLANSLSDVAFNAAGALAGAAILHLGAWTPPFGLA